MEVNEKKLLNMAIFAGEIMLKNGAETYRVEDTIFRLCRSRNVSEVEVFVTPTGIFASINPGVENNENIITYVKRIKSRAIDLNKVSEVNDFSRRFVEAEISIDEAMSQLKKIDLLPHYPLELQALFGGVASGFFALLFGANSMEFIAALVTSIVVTLSVHFLIKMEFNLFITNIAGGAMSALIAILLSLVLPFTEVDKVVTGAIMVMVPGVAMTNAVRDSIAGDLVSGLARGAEALLIAVSIAFGVGFILRAWMFIKGVGL
ncbi:threonine/serine exporter family protein [Alkaliphilus serpentinus]|uniref:Threonine/serine exporter family protein n=1 Tax=Alkaliphilus serpentinus TaxID=1482731 RepID=A0A833HNB7_9FIRM|nr:threonine/serine exporter family protein [Alkaliphilus serpentinus]KAB3527657.1 threonine/serine exporter family protein [Alkaliphilus serpentinus]